MILEVVSIGESYSDLEGSSGYLGVRLRWTLDPSANGAKPSLEYLITFYRQSQFLRSALWARLGLYRLLAKEMV